MMTTSDHEDHHHLNDNNNVGLVEQRSTLAGPTTNTDANSQVREEESQESRHINYQEDEDGESDGSMRDIRIQNSHHDQLPDVESYKAMIGYRAKPSKKPGKTRKMILNKLASRLSSTALEVSSSNSNTSDLVLLSTTNNAGEESDAFRRLVSDPPERRIRDPPEQRFDSRIANTARGLKVIDRSLLVEDPSGETFEGEEGCEEDDCQLQNNSYDAADEDLVLFPKSELLPPPTNLRFCWRFVSLTCIAALLAILYLTSVITISSRNGWANGTQRSGGSDVKSGNFIRGETKEYLAVRNYLLNIGELPYDRDYDEYDPSSEGPSPTTSEPQPIANESLFNESSPQYLAAQWLAHGDQSLLRVPTTDDKVYNQRYAVAAIYFAFNGNDWTRAYNFMSSGHICTWKEEYDLRDVAEEAAADGPNADLADLVDNIHGDGWKYNGDSNVNVPTTVVHGVHGCVKDVKGNLYPKALYLPHNNLQGSIPDEIGILNDLEILNLEFNPLVGGKLTDRLQELRYLRHLGLQFCNHEGNIPMWIPTLSRLEFLGLGDNLWDGDIPHDIGLLSNLKLLGLDNNDLHGDLAMLSPLSNLESLYLENTFIQGGINSVIMELWPKLEEIDLSSCDLTGTLPADFWRKVSPQLKVLDLHGNKLNGPIPIPPPENAASLPWELEFLALNENQFSGIVPGSISHFEKLKHLDVGENGFSSSLPETISGLTNLEYFIAGKNDFALGEVPKFLIELTELRELNIGQANLIGTIPAFLQYLSHLKILDLHSNGLTGVIPTDIVGLTTLRHLVLKGNELNGDFPSYLSELTNLEVLLVEQNQFRGSADAICDAAHRIEDFVADCGDITGVNGSNRRTVSQGVNNSLTRDGPVGDFVDINGTSLSSSQQVGRISCRCCSMCCNVGDTSCHKWVQKGNMDTIWKYGYKKKRYSYYL